MENTTIKNESITQENNFANVTAAKTEIANSDPLSNAINAVKSLIASCKSIEEATKKHNDDRLEQLARVYNHPVFAEAVDIAIESAKNIINSSKEIEEAHERRSRIRLEQLGEMDNLISELTQIANNIKSSTNSTDSDHIDD